MSSETANISIHKHVTRMQMTVGNVFGLEEAQRLKDLTTKQCQLLGSHASPGSGILSSPILDRVGLPSSISVRARQKKLCLSHAFISLLAPFSLPSRRATHLVNEILEAAFETERLHAYNQVLFGQEIQFGNILQVRVLDEQEDALECGAQSFVERQDAGRRRSQHCHHLVSVVDGLNHKPVLAQPAARVAQLLKQLELG